MFDLDKTKIAIIGLGYVGLPLAVEFSKKFSVIGFDISEQRIQELQKHNDVTLEVSEQDLCSADNLVFSSNEQKLADCNVFIVTVPTPIDQHNQPNLNPIKNASKMISAFIDKGSVVVFESTVYPGATEEICVPIIELHSKLKLNKDFFVGYSPERINPGDKEHKLTSILKIVSGSNHESANFINKLYQSIITAGTYLASSIKVAEAAKVIENTQRDVNIALINELSIIFNKLDIDTQEVLDAAETKWNFLSFKPGLVGGHCIGVDPYYLTHKAQAEGYHPEMILAGRRLNDEMPKYVVSQLVKKMLNKKIQVNSAKILVMGFTFKENCPDIRNTKVIDVISELEEYEIQIDILDPWCNPIEVKSAHGLDIIKADEVKHNTYDAILMMVNHQEFSQLGVENIHAYGKKNYVLYDLKCIFTKNDSDIRL